MLVDPDSDVWWFHQKFGHDAPSRPTPLSEKTLALRLKLLREEFGELMEAMEAGDFVGTVSEAIDLMYVTMGTLVSMGVDADGPWAEVQRANMEKEAVDDVDGVPQKPLKPQGWLPPQIAAELEKQGWRR